MSLKPLKMMNIQGVNLLPSSFNISNILYFGVYPVVVDQPDSKLLQDRIRYYNVNYLIIKLI